LSAATSGISTMDIDAETKTLSPDIETTASSPESVTNREEYEWFQSPTLCALSCQGWSLISMCFQIKLNPLILPILRAFGPASKLNRRVWGRNKHFIVFAIQQL